MKAIEVKNLFFRYEDLPVLEDINFEVDEKDFVGIIGPNGGGKTTLIKILVGLLKSQQGTVNIFGKPVSVMNHLIGYVPQNFNFDSSFPISVIDVAKMGRINQSKKFKNSAEDQLIAEECLKKVDMFEMKDKLIGNLSGGQKQRVLIARALSAEPKILILDEPTASIDSKAGLNFYELLHNLNEEMTIIMISHDIGVISQYVEKIACLNKKLVFHDSKEISREMLEQTYQCPVDLIAHGLPHRILDEHEHKH
ncbi:zinc abc transporter, atp-binding protein znuc [hydrocarbon metagenome]|uniref:Zinc abc transporter, atp-binding protein znuc n=1 Tax=hydrocarbon metagenome TaxID=938273 RepID=A0A0W8G196_9ZZZZ